MERFFCKTRFVITLSIALLFSLSLNTTSCEKEEENGGGSSSSVSTKTKASKPEISVLTSAATTTDLTVVFKVKIGSQEDYSTKVVMSYGTSSSNLSNSRTAVFNNIAGRTTVYQYYKASVTGLRSGTKYYFKGECSNAGGTDATGTKSITTKR